MVDLTGKRVGARNRVAELRESILTSLGGAVRHDIVQSLAVPAQAQARSNIGAASSARFLEGTGMPNGVISAPPGAYYMDTAGTNGAWRWLKKSGTGNIGWAVVHGDTGWRDLSSVLLNGWEGLVRIKRDASMVHMGIHATVVGTSATFVSVPAGFKVPAPGLRFAEPGIGTITTSSVSGNMWASSLSLTSTMTDYHRLFSWPTDQAWPATLPGSPA